MDTVKQKRLIEKNTILQLTSVTTKIDILEECNCNDSDVVQHVVCSGYKPSQNQGPVVLVLTLPLVLRV